MAVIIIIMMADINPITAVAEEIPIMETIDNLTTITITTIMGITATTITTMAIMATAIMENVIITAVDNAERIFIRAVF